MNRKLVGFSIILIGFIALCAFLFYLYVNGFFPSWLKFWENEGRAPVSSEEPVDRSPKNNKIPLEIDNDSKKVISFDEENLGETEEQTEERNVTEFGKEDLKRIASSFAERFGSYSNQSNFSNVEDLEIYMTDKMKAWSETFVVEHRGTISEADDYFGITTKAINAEILEYDDEGGIARIRVVCRRRESKNTLSNTGEVYSQDIVVEMKKEYEAWKIDSAFWEN